MVPKLAMPIVYDNAAKTKWTRAITARLIPAAVYYEQKYSNKQAYQNKTAASLAPVDANSSSMHSFLSWNNAENAGFFHHSHSLRFFFPCSDQQERSIVACYGL